MNRYTLTESARVLPIPELLQQFHGSKFITRIDLSSAFLPKGLKRISKKYTSFLFDSQPYKFRRCPYGFSNSLPAYVRTLELTLRSNTYPQQYPLALADDVTANSPTFELLLRHLDTVLSTLTRAEFALNAGKCNFCKTEISFLGHVIRQGVESRDPGRIAVILNYPAPRYQRKYTSF